MDNMTDFIATDLYGHYAEEFNLLSLEEQEEEGPLLSREEYYEYKILPVDYFRYRVHSIGPRLSTTLYKLDAKSCKWPELLELFRSTEPESWNHKFYENYRVLDGSEWSLEVQIDGKQYISKGRNAWPNELQCLEGSHLRSDIFDLLEKDIDPYAVISDSESIRPENEMPEVTRSSADESEEEVVKTKPYIIPKDCRPSTFSEPLVKRPDVIFFKDKWYILLSDPVGQCVLNGSIMAWRHYEENFDEFWNVQKRGFNVEWIIDGNQLKILRFIGSVNLTNSLEDGLYLKFYDHRRGDLFKSRHEWCRHFALFSGELKLYDYEQMMRASKLGWLLGPKDNITLTVKAGEVVQERASKTYYRPNPFINLSSSSNAVSSENVFAGIVAYIFVLFLPLWIKIWISWPLDGLSNLCFYAFQAYWIYSLLENLRKGKPDWLE